MYRLQVILFHVRVDLGRSDAGVPEQFLDGPQVGAAGQEVGSEGVPQRVRTDAGVDARRQRALTQDPEDAVAVQGTAGSGEEEPITRTAVEDGATAFEPRLDCLGCRSAQRDPPLLAPLAHAPDQAVGEANVFQGPVRRLLHAGSRGVERLEQRAVAQIDGTLLGDRREEACNGLPGEHPGQRPGPVAPDQAVRWIPGEPAHGEREAHEGP